MNIKETELRDTIQRQRQRKTMKEKMENRQNILRASHLTKNAVYCQQHRSREINKWRTSVGVLAQSRLILTPLFLSLCLQDCLFFSKYSLCFSLSHHHTHTSLLLAFSDAESSVLVAKIKEQHSSSTINILRRTSLVSNKDTNYQML